MPCRHFARIFLRSITIVALLSFCATCNSRNLPTSQESVAKTQATSRPVAVPIDVDPRHTLPYLASDELAGRAPGTPELDKAADFTASEFERIGLEPPPGMNDYFQPFTMPLSTTLGPGTSLLLNDKPLVLNTDFSPLSLTGEGPFEGKVVFVGYGITHPKSDSQAIAAYDDYAGMDVHGKVVLAMREEPRDAAGKSRFAGQNQKWSDGVYFGAKAKNAAAHGAAALLIVTRPASGGADQVMMFAREPSVGGGEHIPVIQISRRAADLMLEMSRSKDLATLQNELDATLRPEPFELNDIDVSGDVTIKKSSARVKNVVACLPGHGEHEDEYVVVGAHYDHLGKGQLGHMLGGAGSIYHGADDNASGTAAVLDLAAKMKEAGPLPRSVIFALFTGEEEGLIGSDHFIKNPPVPLDKIVAMLNLDMVGRMKDDTLLMGGWGTAPAFEGIMKQAVEGTGVRTQSFEKGGFGPSDHMSFALKKIPVLFLFTGLHMDYHRPTDTADKINYAGMDKVVQISQRIVDAMAAMPRQTYDGSNDSKATMAFAAAATQGIGDRTVGSRRAALGVVPDYSSIDAKDGVHITGVGGGSPAEAAGLQADDVLTKWDDKPLVNLQDLSDELAQAEPGQKVTITVLRGGKSVVLHATLGERKQ
jgi:hypothetical protein